MGYLFPVEPNLFSHYSLISSMTKLVFSWFWFQMLLLWCRLCLNTEICMNYFQFTWIAWFTWILSSMLWCYEVSLILWLCMKLPYIHEFKLVEYEPMLFSFLHCIIIIMYVFLMVYWLWECHLLLYTNIDGVDDGRTPPTIHLIWIVCWW